MLNNLTVIGDLVDYYHILFLAENIGYKSLPKKDQEILKSKGYVNVVKKHDDLLSLAYKFGKLSTEGDSNILDKINYVTLQNLSKDKLALSSEDRFVLEHIKASFYNDVKRAANRVKDQINTEIVKISKDRRYYIRTKLKRKLMDKDFRPDPAILNHLTKFLGEQKKDWNNHFDLITSYRMHQSFQEGVGTTMLNKYGINALIFYNVHKDACSSCKKTYLYSNGRPRMFKLIDVISNGDNVGRKKDDWLATLAPIHPNCRCSVRHFKSKILKKQ